MGFTMNVTVPLIPIPSGQLPDKNVSDAYRTAVATALKHGVAPIAMDISGLERKSLFLPPALHAKIIAAAEQNGISVHKAFAGLTQAGINIIHRERMKTISAAASVEVPFLNPRPGQDRYYRAIAASLGENRVCMAEGSTGIGKSRALVAAALIAASDGKKPAVITAPTLAILGDSLWREYETIAPDWPRKDIRVRFFPGSTEFVDHERLETWLSEAANLGEPVDAAVQAWIKSGGFPLEETPLIRAMISSGHEVRWLMHDLRTLATELDPSEFTYRGNNAEIEKLLLDIRRDASDADVIFCTQAMLARAQQSDWEWFPEPCVLIVDEAHQFEQSVANIHSNRLSLYSLRHKLRIHQRESGVKRGSAVEKARASITAIITFLRGQWDEGVTLAVTQDMEQFNVWQEMLAKLEKELSSRALAGVGDIDNARATITSALSLDSRTYIEYSPDRRFPSILSGTASVSGLLGSLWKTAAGGAVLASATLYMPDDFGNPKCDYAASLLAVPSSRLDTPSPVVADWMMSVPVLHVPSPAKAPQYARPINKERTKQTEADWLNEIATQVHGIIEQAIGGTLVLCTSYAQVAAISASLIAMDTPENRIVTQSKGIKFSLVQQTFRDRHAQGLRPVLVATGAAWTGIDLTDKSVPAEDDTLLTDLVVTCLPVGLNRTSTMTTRIMKFGTHPIIREAVMMLRQGIGRLVRSNKSRNKHIWFLDGRVWAPWPGMESLQKSAKYLLGQYKKQKTF